jgi:hypothetical protein
MGRPRSDAVRREIQLGLVVPGDDAVPVPATLCYDITDPYAVRAEFITGMTEGVSWIFARDLLMEGVQQPTGEGDVRVWPATSPDGPVVLISLDSPDGQALLSAPLHDVVDFVEHTRSVVPQGQESKHLDLDAALNAILRAA